MSHRIIENSDRGLTINKALAWTILSSFLVGGMWVGIQVNAASSGMQTIAERQSEDRAEIRDNRTAINNLRSSNARIDQRLSGIEDSLNKTEISISEILRYLRERKNGGAME